MRTTGLLASASAAAVLALGLSTGSAGAATPSTDPTATASAQEPGYVSVSPGDAVPGQLVHVSGTCPTPVPGAPEPRVLAVTSAAFGHLVTFTKTDPTAFDGTTVVSSIVASGSYPVAAICSNGLASTRIEVTAQAPPTPAPRPAGPPVAPPWQAAPAPHGEGGTVVAGDPAPGSAWGWIVGGLLVALGTGGAAVAIGRRQAPSATAPAPRERAEKTLMDPSRR